MDATDPARRVTLTLLAQALAGLPIPDVVPEALAVLGAPADSPEAKVLARLVQVVRHVNLRRHALDGEQFAACQDILQGKGPAGEV